MRYYILATHGKFAEGIMDSVHLISGEYPCVTCLCAFVDPEENLTERVVELLHSYSPEDEIVVVADLLGGSVCNEFIRQLDRPNLHVLAGLNLSLLLELLTSSGEPIKEVIDNVIQLSTNSVKYCNELIKEQQDVNEQF